MSKTLKDLCFFTAVLLPPLALILFFTVKVEEYKKAFKIGMLYGLVLWIAVIMIISFAMCDPNSGGYGDKSVLDLTQRFSC